MILFYLNGYDDMALRILLGGFESKFIDFTDPS